MKRGKLFGRIKGQRAKSKNTVGHQEQRLSQSQSSQSRSSMNVSAALVEWERDKQLALKVAAEANVILMYSGHLGTSKHSLLQERGSGEFNSSSHYSYLLVTFISAAPVKVQSERLHAWAFSLFLTPSCHPLLRHSHGCHYLGLSEMSAVHISLSNGTETHLRSQPIILLLFYT